VRRHAANPTSRGYRSALVRGGAGVRGAGTGGAGLIAIYRSFPVCSLSIVKFFAAIRKIRMPRRIVQSDKGNENGPKQ
jgi:hypothetical protein